MELSKNPENFIKKPSVEVGQISHFIFDQIAGYVIVNYLLIYIYQWTSYRSESIPILLHNRELVASYNTGQVWRAYSINPKHYIRQTIFWVIVSGIT